MTEPRSLLTSEVAIEMRVTENTVRRWLREGRMKGVKPSGSRMGAYRIPSSEVDRMLAVVQESDPEAA